MTLTAGSPKVNLPLATAADADDAFSFSVPNASLGPIGLDKLVVTYDGDGLWEIAAGVSVPVINAHLGIEAGILNGNFNYAGAELDFGNPGIGPFGPIYLQRVKFRVELEPKESECVPHIGVKTFEYLGAKFTHDYGVPTFALCGEVGLTAGPQVLNTAGDLARRRPERRHLRRPPERLPRLRRHEGRQRSRSPTRSSRPTPTAS